MMEVYAGFLSHADHHIGRVLDELEAAGGADNTVIALISDNGSSAEGGPNGSWNQIRHYISDEPDDLGLELAHYDDLGGFRSSGHYPWGWALAGNTPFRRWKRYTFEGGVRDPLILSWPAGLAAQGELRHQYCHVTDVMPTIMDLIGVAPPSTVGGIEQMSFDGVSMRAVLENRDSANHRTSQYYECWGSRAIYHDGWKAVTNHVNQLTAAERDAIIGSHVFAEDRWELFLADGELRWVAVVHGREHRAAAVVPIGACFVGVEVTPTDVGLFTMTLTADDIEIGRGDEPVPLAANWAPDGAFLTVGYGRPFPVCDDYQPPAPAPDAMASLTIETGQPPPFDFDAEMAHAMRHQ